MDDAVTAREKGTLTRIEASLSNKINEIYSLKEEIEELNFINEESEASVDTWATETETKLNIGK